MNSFVNYLNSRCVFFEATLTYGKPYVAEFPRNHESLFLVTKGRLFNEYKGKITVINEGQIGYISKGRRDISGAFECDEVSYIAVNFDFGEADEGFVSQLGFHTLASENNRGYPYRILFERALREFLLPREKQLQ